jgi:hypothetical protein
MREMSATRPSSTFSDRTVRIHAKVGMLRAYRDEEGNGSSVRTALSIANSAGFAYHCRMRNSTDRRAVAVRIPTLVARATLVVATLACGGGEEPTAAVAPSGPKANFIKLVSDPGDGAGGGKRFEYDQTNAEIRMTFLGSRIQVIVRGEEQWIGTVAMATGTTLRPGTYSNVSRFDDTASGVAGLYWGYGEGACYTVTGSITIDSVTYAGLDVTQLDLHFDQHCDGRSAALRGTIHWRADDTTKPPGPVIPIPANLWRPSAERLPASGNYVALSSEPGDPIGLGRDTILTGPAADAAVALWGRTRVAVWTGDYVGDFEAMLGTDPLAVGYYANATKWFSGNPARPRLHFWVQGRGCGVVTGWYAIDRIVLTDAGITALDLRFEQHCDGSTAGLHGAV